MDSNKDELNAGTLTAEQLTAGAAAAAAQYKRMRAEADRLEAREAVGAQTYGPMGPVTQAAPLLDSARAYGRKLGITPWLRNWFSYHSPKGDQAERYAVLRAGGLELATLIVQSCPSGPERDQALLRLRETVMWANCAIACGEADHE